MKFRLSFILMAGVFILISCQFRTSEKEIFNVQWKYNTGSPIVASPVSDGTTVFIGSSDSCFYAIDEKEGQLKWTYKTEGEIRSTAALSADILVFMSGDGTLHALNQKSGERIWEFRTAGEKKKDIWDYFLSSPKIRNNKVYVGSGAGIFYAIDLFSGEEIFSFKTGGIIHSSPVIKEGKAYFGSYDGYFYALDAQSGKLIWKFKAVGDTYFPKGAIQNDAVFVDHKLVVGSRDFNIYALDAEKGFAHWNMKEKGSWVVSPVKAAGDTVFAGTSDSHRLLAMGTKRGQLLWSADFPLNIFGGVAVNRDHVFVGCLDGKFYMLNRNNGEIMGHYTSESHFRYRDKILDASGAMRKDLAEVYDNDILAIYDDMLKMGSFLATPLLSGDAIITASTDGNVYCFSYAGQDKS